MCSVHISEAAALKHIWGYSLRIQTESIDMRRTTITFWARH